MTRQRNDSHSTEFGLWLRKQDALESRRTGFTATNLDFILHNFKTKRFMLLEEKRFMSEVSFPQYEAMRIVHDAIVLSGNKNYCGMFLLQFSNAGPDDSDQMLINRIYTVNNEQLISFLSMDWFKDGKPTFCFELKRKNFR